MNNFIEQIDERRRQRLLLERGVAQKEVSLQHRGSLTIPSEESRLSVSSEETAASLRERARQLKEEAHINRDKASCVTGSQQSFRIRVAELREKEAARLITLADEADARILSSGSSLHQIGLSDGSNTPSVSAASVCGSSIPSFSRQTSATEERMRELLEAAAERRDKASCVKGGKQRALLAMAERIEAEAESLRASLHQQDQLQQIRCSDSLTDHAGCSTSSVDHTPFGNEASSPNCYHHTQKIPILERQDSFESTGQPVIGTKLTASRQMAPAGMRSGGMRSHPLADEEEREMFERISRDSGNTLPGKRRASVSSMASQGRHPLSIEAERLRQEALECRDKASCCSGAKQRQLISLAEMKERRAADMITSIGDAAFYVGNEEQCGAIPSLQKAPSRTPHFVRAAGELRGRVDPKGEYGIF